jgi:hypothetical protein
MENVVISKEYVDKIKRFAAIRPEETFHYVPKVYRELPKELKPVFILRPIAGEDALRFSDLMRGDVTVSDGVAQVKIKRGEYVISVVHSGLVGWNNYYDVNGNDIPYKSNISCLPMALLEELCDVITERASLTYEEVLGLK